MNRRWQKDGTGRYETLKSLGWFTSQLPPLNPEKNLGLASVIDLYSVFSALHAKGRNPQPAANTAQGFYYLIADSPATKQVTEEGMPVVQVRSCWEKGRGPELARVQCAACEQHLQAQWQPACASARGRRPHRRCSVAHVASV